MILIKQAVIETRLWLRRRETVIFTLALPVMFLLFFGALYGNDHLPHSRALYIDYIVPAYSVYAIMAVCLGTISANLAQERQFGILKRLGGTPLPRFYLLIAKAIAAGILAGAVIVVMLAVGILGYHVHIHGNQLVAVVVLVIGILSFACMGMTLGGTVKAEAAVAAGSLLYLALSFLGGVFVPLYQFPQNLRTAAMYLPSERMVDAMQQVWTFGHGFNSAVRGDLWVMLVWLVVAVFVAVRRFRWE